MSVATLCSVRIANGVVEFDGCWFTLGAESSIHADGNGDGDPAGMIVRVIDPVAHAVSNLPYAMYPSTPIALVAAGDFQLFAIHESDRFDVDRDRSRRSACGR